MQAGTRDCALPSSPGFPRSASGGKAPRRPGRRRDPRSLRGGRGLLLLGRRARAGAAAPADLDFVRAEQRPRSPGGAGSSPARGTRQRRRKKRRHMQYEGAEISLGSVRPPRSTEKVKPLEPRSRKAPNKPNVD
ncbi:unnamed protein product [Prorocentrum cordatum]|uniref:Uncharacterized protein n=1 Tax=Prorocentrum cordatum TaxID=2364126 RepID=A0ABN9QCR1_9DINO|nr:unnamed protein product [Polarella glacialis]